MNFRKLICFTLTISSLILIGCASTSQITELSSEIQKLNRKIDQVNENINVLNPAIEQIKNEANRANKRLDNQISIYKK
ncbi:major outer membrane lipoprotein [Candidatus Blochmanniella floridana]|uniref:Major outer membrane lipoprotein Lpp n=1 Tax=Blochmanniella floridana TaxID=203907 RepID=Q7VR58_BLOFL|nr:major outer membrane lipoprotein [Candidatus Blochmannia floridanus]